MNVLKTLDIKQSLQKKGFREDPDRKRHIYYFFYYNGEKTSLNTHLSHGADEVDDHLIGMMSKEVKISKNDFINLVRCPFTEEMFIDAQKKNGILT